MKLKAITIFFFFNVLFLFSIGIAKPRSKKNNCKTWYFIVLYTQLKHLCKTFIIKIQNKRFKRASTK